MSRRVVLAAALMSCAFGPFGSRAAPVTVEARPEAPARTQVSPPAHFLYLSYRFYQTFVSPMDGARCSHHPTCSRFAFEAVRRRGLLLGLMLTVDRLWKGQWSSTLRAYPALRLGDRWFIYDPLEAETFWLDGVRGEASFPLPPGQG